MKLQQSVALAAYSSLSVGGPAETLIELEATDNLRETLSQYTQPMWVLGAGTNCLISDKGLPGVVIINHAGSITRKDDTHLRADSGVTWDDLVQKAISFGLYGLEFSSGIPGSVGAAVVGNIAAYGHSVAKCLTEATLLDTADGSIVTWQNQDFAFDYRTSALQKVSNRNLVVLDATFEFSPEPTGNLEYDSALKVAAELNISPDSLENRREIIIETRRRAGSLLDAKHAGLKTAGSFFKNPLVNPEQVQALITHEETGVSRQQLLHQNKIHGGSSVRVSASHVLLAAGFERGQTWGNVRLHPDHILKVENTGGATAQEIYDVVQLILKTVKQKLNIVLEPEVRFLGEF
jgi:UDP-N-acetylmuramate dehydrogenase